MSVVVGGVRRGEEGGGQGVRETVRGATRLLVEGDPAWDGGALAVRGASRFQRGEKVVLLGEREGKAR